MRRLRVACESAKRILSTTNQTSIELDSLHEGLDFFSNITRARFDELCNDIYKRCTNVIESLLNELKLDKSTISDAIMSGGGAYIPRLQTAIQEFLGLKEVKKSINPDEVVAFGAAIQGL